MPQGLLMLMLIVNSFQAVEKRPSAAFPSSFVAATYIKYDSLLRTSEALHLVIFEQPVQNHFFNNLFSPERHIAKVKIN